LGHKVYDIGLCVLLLS